MVNEIQKKSLQYVLNTNGGATKSHFTKDHDPIGHLLWNEVDDQGLVEVRADGKIYLTPKGNQVLTEKGS